MTKHGPGWDDRTCMAVFLNHISELHVRVVPHGSRAACQGCTPWQ